MDELKDAWGELETKSENFTGLSEEEIHQSGKKKSYGVIEKLHEQVKRKFYLALFFTVVIGAGIPFAFPLASQILLLILWVAYMVGTILLYQEKNILSKGVDMSQDILHGMKAYHQRVKRVIHYEEIVALTLYPVSVSGGFFLGRQLVDREAEIMNETLDWVILIVSIVILTIGGHWFSRWLNRLAFGKYLDKLEENIKELEREL